MFTIEEDKVSKDVSDFIRKNKEDAVYNALEIGIFVTNKVQLNSDLDFVKTQINHLISSTDKTFSGLAVSYSDIMKKVVEEKFDPSVSNSYSKRFGDFLNQKASELKDTVALQLQNVKSSLDKIEGHTSESDSSSLGKVKKMVEQTQNFIQEQFKEDSTTSYAYLLKQKLNETFQNLDANLKSVIEGSVRAEFSTAIEPIMKEFIVIREIISKEEGKSEIMEITSKKGFEFEEELFTKLQSIAQPFSDSVEETADTKEIGGSKKGDFTYFFSELNTKIVIEAKDKEVRQKESLAYMKLALTSRGCEFGILVSKSPEQLQKQIGRWNFYDNVIICSQEDIEISLRFARFLIQFRKVKTDGINVGEIKSKISKLLEEIKKFQAIRTNLTNIESAVTAGTEKIRTDIDSIQESIKHTLNELEISIGK